MDVKEYLEHLDPNALITLGQHRGISFVRMGDSGQMGLLAERLLDREWLVEQFEGLSRIYWAILEDIRRHDGRASGPELVEAIEKEGHRGAEYRVREMVSMGLLLFSLPASKRPKGRPNGWSEWEATRPGSTLHLPPEVQELMGPPPEPPRPAEEEPPACLEKVADNLTPVRMPLANAVRDLFAIFQAIRARPLGLRQDGEIRKPDLVRFNKAIAPTRPIYEDEEGRSDFLFGLCWPLGLLRTSDDETAIEAVPEGLSFFSLPTANQARRLLELWHHQDSWNELSRVLNVFAGYYGSEAPDAKRLAAARGVLIETLKTPEAAGKWISTASLLRVVKREHKEILFSHRPLRFRVGEPEDPDAMPYSGVSPKGVFLGGKSHFDKRRDWDKVEGAFILSVLREPLQWLGLVELALDSSGEPIAFRLTAEGAAALGLATEAAEPAGEAPRGLVVQPNFEMVLLPEVTGFAVAIELDRFADRVNTDRAVLYRLSRESVYRGLREGASRGPALETLERLSGGAIPQNVRHSLEEWAGRFGSIRLHREALVVSGDDGAAVAALLRDAGIRDARPVGATAAHLNVAPARLKLLRARPDVLWCDYAAETPKVIRAEEDGRLVVPERHLTHYLRYRLEQFARPVEKGVFELDQERLRAGVRAGLRAADIEQFLAAATTGPLPPFVRLALRGWSGAYRDIGMAPVSALNAPPEVLDLLLGIPGVREHILARPAPTLALVDPARADTVREVAGNFGLFMRDRLELERPAAAGPLAGAEPVYTLPPRDLRSLLQRAISEHREAVLLLVEQESHRYGYRGAYKRAEVSTERVTPLELIRSGSRYDLKARRESGETDVIDTAAIHAIRLLDPA